MEEGIVAVISNLPVNFRKVRIWAFSVIKYKIQIRIINIQAYLEKIVLDLMGLNLLHAMTASLIV